jgi:hypothetical protein
MMKGGIWLGQDWQCAEVEEEGEQRVWSMHPWCTQAHGLAWCYGMTWHAPKLATWTFASQHTFASTDCALDTDADATVFTVFLLARGAAPRRVSAPGLRAKPFISAVCPSIEQYLSCLAALENCRSTAYRPSCLTSQPRTQFVTEVHLIVG